MKEEYDFSKVKIVSAGRKAPELGPLCCLRCHKGKTQYSVIVGEAVYCSVCGHIVSD